MKTVALRKKKNKKSKKPTTPPNFNKPNFEGTSPNRETAKKKVMAQLERQGIAGADKLNAMNRGKLTQDSSGNYIFRTDAYSKAD